MGDAHPCAAGVGLHRSPRVGFVVSRAVGPATTRNLVKRRLRHLSRERLLSARGEHAGGPGAAGGRDRDLHPELAAELDRCLATVGATKVLPAEAVISG